MVLAPLNPITFGHDEVVVTLSQGRTDHGHTGLGFWDEQGVPNVYHLDGHHRVLLEPAAAKQGAWLTEPVPIPPTALKQLAVYVRGVVKSLCQQGGTVDYGIDFIAAKGSFAENGDYTPPVGSTGLTCSSFVVELLRGFHLNLIDETTWQSSEDNVKWATGLAEIFDNVAKQVRAANQGDALAQMFEERARVITAAAPQGLRLLPTEVAGAVSMPPDRWPVAYNDAQGPAHQARAVLSEAVAAATTG
ncbi:hypothetical protein [Dyella telluris]|uniref:Uncharacterized protein n=1 Tax=Dyella telluris TaxID=2763498 RepID=A0A7G8Q9N2_9GAMM|nr:hypothetical protein [Dyella telluris]QNK03490.1 hypothetical protein H8F01_10445 [Dyella telluris]